MDQEARDDERLLRRAVLAGDEAAWRVLYDRHFGWLYHYALYRSRGDIPAAQDLVQEAWEVAVRRIRRFDPDRAPFRAWIKGIADHLARNRDRKHGRETATADVDGGLAPEGAHEARDMVALVMSALPARYRRVLLARYREEHSVQDIARDWNVSYKAAESLLSRARAAFRRAYDEIDDT